MAVNRWLLHAASRRVAVDSWQLAVRQLAVDSWQLAVASFKKKFEEIFLLHNLTKIMGQPLFQNSQFERASRKWRQLKLEILRHPWRQLMEAVEVGDRRFVNSQFKVEVGC